MNKQDVSRLRQPGRWNTVYRIPADRLCCRGDAKYLILNHLHLRYPGDILVPGFSDRVCNDQCPPEDKIIGGAKGSWRKDGYHTFLLNAFCFWRSGNLIFITILKMINGIHVIELRPPFENYDRIYWGTAILLWHCEYSARSEKAWSFSSQSRTGAGGILTLN